MDKKEVTEQDLAQAFVAEEVAEEPAPENKEKSTKSKDGKKSPMLLLSIIMVVVGVIMLIVGVVLLVLDLTRGPVVTDGEYLMSAKQWVLSDGTNCATADLEIENGASDADGVVGTSEEIKTAVDGAGEANCASTPSVIWKFTEVGKGTLTTNGHINDYDFIWAIEDGKLKIETKWLYDLENEFDYEIRRGEGALVLKDGDKETVLVGDFTDSE